MHDAPIITIATVIEKRDERTFWLELPNGKRVLGHCQKKDIPLRDSLVIGDKVKVEMTPFDFEKARFYERAD